jgi:hypothetical protein
VTLFGIFLTPVFYYIVQWFADRRPARAEDGDDDAEPGPGHGATYAETTA